MKQEQGCSFALDNNDDPASYILVHFNVMIMKLSIDHLQLLKVM